MQSCVVLRQATFVALACTLIPIMGSTLSSSLGKKGHLHELVADEDMGKVAMKEKQRGRKHEGQRGGLGKAQIKHEGRKSHLEAGRLHKQKAKKTSRIRVVTFRTPEKGSANTQISGEMTCVRRKSPTPKFVSVKCEENTIPSEIAQSNMEMHRWEEQYWLREARHNKSTPTCIEIIHQLQDSRVCCLFSKPTSLQARVRQL